MTANTPAPIRTWAAERLDPAVHAGLHRLARMDGVTHVAVMPDVHPSTPLCVGVAFATREVVYPETIGGDIGCGMSIVALDSAPRRIRPDFAAELLDAMREAVPIHRHPRGAIGPRADRAPDLARLSRRDLERHIAKDAAHQLGTLGTGNHFLEVQRDADDGRLWLMVHSGSRAAGQAVRDVHVADATERCGGLARLDIRDDAGRAWLADMHWARAWAAANRRAMLDRTCRVLRDRLGLEAIEATREDCDHNHVAEEVHGGGDVFVHRKGAMPAAADQPGVVPGSMGSPSFHVVGRGEPAALCSSAHGAGRALSRSQARRRIDRGRLASELADVHVDPASLGGLLDEAPSAYKDIHAVMKAQRPLVKVRRVLHPVVTHKGGGARRTTRREAGDREPRRGRDRASRRRGR